MITVTEGQHFYHDVLVVLDKVIQAGCYQHGLGQIVGWYINNPGGGTNPTEVGDIVIGVGRCTAGDLKVHTQNGICIGIVGTGNCKSCSFLSAFGSGSVHRIYANGWLCFGG